MDSVHLQMGHRENWCCQCCLDGSKVIGHLVHPDYVSAVVIGRAGASKFLVVRPTWPLFMS